MVVGFASSSLVSSHTMFTEVLFQHMGCTGYFFEGCFLSWLLLHQAGDGKASSLPLTAFLATSERTMWMSPKSEWIVLTMGSCRFFKSEFRIYFFYRYSIKESQSVVSKSQRTWQSSVHNFVSICNFHSKITLFKKTHTTFCTEAISE